MHAFRATSSPGMNDEPDSTDSIARMLDDFEIIGRRQSSTQKGPGSTSFNTELMRGEPRVMGEADVVNAIKRLPGIETKSDYGSGLVVDGAEPSQTLYSISSAPVFFPYRFGGLFSTFNSEHFKSAEFERGIHDASIPSRLGGWIDFRPASIIPKEVRASANVGMLSSNVAVSAPISKWFAIAAAGRISYVDEIYSKLLNTGDHALGYRFADLNLSSVWRPDSKDCISINIFHSKDHLEYDDTNYALDIAMRWRNSLASAEWSRQGDAFSMRHRAYFSSFSNRLSLSLPQMELRAPASIWTAGVAGDATPDMADSPVHLKCGYEFSFFRITPQSAEFSGVAANSSPIIYRFTPFEARLHASASWEMTRNAALDFGLTASFYRNGNLRKTLFADPRLTLRLSISSYSSLALHLGTYHQYLHQVGFSEIGLSSDFWIPASSTVPLQRQISLAAEYRHFLPGPDITATASIYARHVAGQTEYEGQILQLADQNYNVMDHIITSRGYNAGANISLRKEAGAATFSLSAAYGFARRKYTDDSLWLRGRTDPGFSASASATWRISSHWNIDGNFIFSEGRPYTPAKAIYVIAGNVITDYGKQNSSRFPPYHRLDISASYSFSFKAGHTRFRNYVNLSLINAYGHKNVEIQTFVFDTDTGGYKLRRISSLYRFMPSLSYTILINPR